MKSSNFFAFILIVLFAIIMVDVAFKLDNATAQQHFNGVVIAIISATIGLSILAYEKFSKKTLLKGNINLRSLLPLLIVIGCITFSENCKGANPKSFTDNELITKVVSSLTRYDLNDYFKEKGWRNFREGDFSIPSLTYISPDESFAQQSKLWGGSLTNLSWVRHNGAMPTVECSYRYTYNEKNYKESHLGSEPTEPKLQIKVFGNDSTFYLFVNPDEKTLTAEKRMYLEYAFINIDKYKKKVATKSGFSL